MYVMSPSCGALETLFPNDGHGRMRSVRKYHLFFTLRLYKPRSNRRNDVLFCFSFFCPFYVVAIVVVLS